MICVCNWGTADKRERKKKSTEETVRVTLAGECELKKTKKKSHLRES